MSDPKPAKPAPRKHVRAILTSKTQLSGTLPVRAPTDGETTEYPLGVACDVFEDHFSILRDAGIEITSAK